MNNNLHYDTIMYSLFVFPASLYKHLKSKHKLVATSANVNCSELTGDDLNRKTRGAIFPVKNVFILKPHL